MLLDVSRLPTQATHGRGNDKVDLAYAVYGGRDAIADLVASGLLKHHESFGFAMVEPVMESRQLNWDNPYDFVWFVAGWGKERERYIANAVRKLRPALRLGADTLRLHLHSPNPFLDVVESQQADGTFQWGDFPWGGATFVTLGRLLLPSAVSGLREVEDDAVSKLLAALVGSWMLKIDSPEKYG